MTDWISLDGGRVRLACGDCLKILPELEKGSVDAVVTDPPYGIGFAYDTHIDDPDKYADSMRRVVEASIATGAASCWFWQAMSNADKWHEWFPRGFRLFAACKGFVQFRPTPVQFSWDPVIWWGTPANAPSVYAKDFHVQMLAPFGAGRERIEHPCPRPLEQVEYVCRTATTDGQTILDPFMGSGTTGVACIRTGRKFIGIEIDPGYFAGAVKRIEEELEKRDGRGPLFPTLLMQPGTNTDPEDKP